MSPRSICLVLLSTTLAFSPARTSKLPTQLLPVYGGSGGTNFSRDCGAGRVLTGIRFRSGMDLDAVGLLCRPVLSDGKLAPETTVGTLAGGGGGTSSSASCPVGKVVMGVTVAHGSWVNGVFLRCHAWNSSTRKFGGSSTETGLAVGNNTAQSHSAEACESATQPAAGIRGRSGIFVDAIGLTCDEP